MPGAADAASVPPAYALPLNDGSSFPVYETDIAHWGELYPAVDIRQEVRNMIGWLESNPTRKKTKRGVGSFITSWLSREQDKGGARGSKAPPGNAPKSFDISDPGAYDTSDSII